MSILSKDIFDPIKAFLAGLLDKNPQAAPAVQQAQASITQAATDVEAAGTAVVEPLARDGVNYVLGLVPGGALVEGFADSLIDAVIAGLTARKTAAA
jgi:hypothetical protein